MRQSNEELKIRVLSDYLNEPSEDIYCINNIFNVNGLEYEVISEDEYDRTLKNCLYPIIDEIEYNLRYKKLEYLIPYINWDDYFEYLSLTDFEYDEYYYEKSFYYIKKL